MCVAACKKYDGYKPNSQTANYLSNEQAMAYMAGLKKANNNTEYSNAYGDSVADPQKFTYSFRDIDWDNIQSFPFAGGYNLQVTNAKMQQPCLDYFRIAMGQNRDSIYTYIFEVIIKDSVVQSYTGQRDSVEALLQFRNFTGTIKVYDVDGNLLRIFEFQRNRIVWQGITPQCENCVEPGGGFPPPPSGPTPFPQGPFCSVMPWLCGNGGSNDTPVLPSILTNPCGSGGGGGGIVTSVYDGVTYTPFVYPGKDLNFPWLWWQNPNLSPVLSQELALVQLENIEEFNDSQTPCHATKRIGNVFFAGTLEHWLIQLDYIKRFGGEREYRIPRAGPSGGAGYADMARPGTKELFEIKRKNPTGIASGLVERDNYVAKAQLNCPTSGGPGPWHAGTNYTGASFPFASGTMTSSLRANGLVVYDYDITPIRPVVVTQPVLDKLKKLLKELVNHPNSFDVILTVLCQNNPDVVNYIKGAAIGTAFVIVVGIIIEDILSAGAGLADDWACFIAAYKLVRFALVL